MDSKERDSGTESILSSQFIPTQLPEICAPRIELMKVFHRAAEENFIYIGAPGGSGKTVSALLWLNSCDRISVWLGLDRFDDSPSVFYKLLSKGLYSLQPDNESMRKILSDPSFSAAPAEKTVQLISEMRPTAERYALVLDDMHLIENGEILKSLSAVLKRLPRSFVTIILSRKDCPEEFRSCLKDEEAQLITPEKLRFSENEIRRYFGSLGRFLTPEESKFAYMATDGWAIGVNAVAKSGQIESNGMHYTFSAYFEDHLWNEWSAELRDFCLKTSVADEFDPELADALSSRTDSESVMTELSRSNTFLSRLHDNTYRYHHLFLEFLREKAAQTIDLSPLYKSAAAYYRKYKDYTRALRFWFLSGDFKGIDTFLYLFLFENHRGVIAEYTDFLRGFFEQEFPEKAFRESPPLHVLCAWYYYLTSQREQYEFHMDEIYRKLPRIAIGEDSRFVEYALLAYSVDHRSSILEKVKKFDKFGQFIKKFTPEGLATKIASFTHNLPYLHRSNIDYSDLALVENGAEFIESTFSRLLGAEWAYIKPMIPACFAFEHNQLESAEMHIAAAKAKLKPDSKIEGRICVLALEYDILYCLGKRGEADNAFKELTSLTETQAQFFMHNLKAMASRAALLNGDRATARKWLNEYFVIETDRIELYRVYQHFTTARAYIALGEKEKAEKYLNMLVTYGRNFNRPLDEGEALILTAAMKEAFGDKKAANAALEKALERLQPYGFVRAFADEGASLLPVLKRIAAKVDSPNYDGVIGREYLLEVTLACHAFAKEHKGLTFNIRRQDKPIKLSKQQAMVLDYLSKGYRNAEICEMTGLSLPTIKSHTALAYRKLCVNNAMDAILKARELKLI